MRFAMFARAALTVDFYMRGANPALKFDDLDVRMTAYRALLAGAASHTYGNNNIWQMWGPGREPRLGADTPWKEALDHPGAFQMGHLRRLFESRPWELLVPDQDLLVGPNPPAPSRSSPRHRPGAAATGCSCSTMRRESTRRRRRPGSNSHFVTRGGPAEVFGSTQYTVPWPRWTFRTRRSRSSVGCGNSMNSARGNLNIVRPFQPNVHWKRLRRSTICCRLPHGYDRSTHPA